MANVAEQSAVTARAGRPFTFTRIRAGASAEFFPGAGSTLHFANRDVDTLAARGIPAGLLQAGDAVKVEYLGRVVFQGDVDTIMDRRGRGDDRVQDVTCAGPWSRLGRLVFRQQWGMGEVAFSSSRVVLGQSALGDELTMAEQLAEIIDFAAEPCGIAAGTMDALAQHLPLDEARDITCADAIRRELRFFPKRIVRFDYSTPTPELEIVEPSDADAAYVADIPKTDRVYRYTAHPVSCVDVAVDAAEMAINGDSLSMHQVWPEDGDTSALDCLHVIMPLARGGGSTSTESFKSEVEPLPDDLNSKDWWKAKHKRLENVPIGAFHITRACRREGAAHDYPNIAKSTRGEIEAAGLKCEVVRYTVEVKIETADDVEENVVLSMDFLTTNARNRTYTWQTGSTATAGETLPEGLARALYEQRSQSLVSEQMTVRLGAAANFPVLGDAADGLYLQSIDVDVADVTARLSFGQPEHLSAEDMRSLLNGFRQRGSASTAALREKAAEDEEEDDDAPGGIPPISSSEWSPGTKAKTTIKGSEGKPIELDSAKVTDGTMQVRTLTIRDESGGTSTVQYLATSDATVDGEKDESEDKPPSSDPDNCDDSHPGGGDYVPGAGGPPPPIGDPSVVVPSDETGESVTCSTC